MLDSKGFDLWADGYDREVGLTDESGSYPFAGYRDVLNGIYRTALRKPGASVLDIGFGTGALTAKLYARGCRIYGQDFSARMIELATRKMPEARLYQKDFAQGLSEPLARLTYDFIVATYSLHHLTDAQKAVFLPALYERLNVQGALLIGDVAFETRADLERCRLQAGGEWDDEEYYFVAEELRPLFPALTFTRVSYCAGILEIPKP